MRDASHLLLASHAFQVIPFFVVFAGRKVRAAELRAVRSSSHHLVSPLFFATFQPSRAPDAINTHSPSTYIVMVADPHVVYRVE